MEFYWIGSDNHQLMGNCLNYLCSRHSQRLLYSSIRYNLIKCKKSALLSSLQCAFFYLKSKNLLCDFLALTPIPFVIFRWSYYPEYKNQDLFYFLRKFLNAMHRINQRLNKTSSPESKF